MSNHKELIVWQKGIALVKSIYELTKAFPREETFGLKSQMQRAAVSISSNIAEGYGRIFPKEPINFLNIALGSAAELETQLIISRELRYVSEVEYTEMSKQNNEVIYMLTALVKSFQK